MVKASSSPFAARRKSTSSLVIPGIPISPSTTPRLPYEPNLRSLSYFPPLSEKVPGGSGGRQGTYLEQLNPQEVGRCAGNEKYTKKSVDRGLAMSLVYSRPRLN